jgi:hypothetical protein
MLSDQALTWGIIYSTSFLGSSSKVKQRWQPLHFVLEVLPSIRSLN